MSDKNINYFLIGANKIAMGGYVGVKYDFLLELVSFIYLQGDEKHQKAITALTKKYISLLKDVGLRPGTINEVPIDLFTKYMIHSENYLATAESNSLVKNIYIKAQLNPTYKEFAFCLYLLGIVNSMDYLKYNKDINFFVSKLSIKKKRMEDSEKLFKTIKITPINYINIMGMFLKNCTEGIDYGYSPYDFIYHMFMAEDIIAKTNTSYNKYMDLMERLQKLNIKEFGCFRVTGKLLNKYTEEIGVMLPMLIGKVKAEAREKVIWKIIYESGNFNLAEAILKNQEFMKVADGSCVNFSVGGHK